MLCDHHLYQVLNIFSTPQGDLAPSKELLSVLSSPQPLATSSLHSASRDMCKWDTRRTDINVATPMMVAFFVGRVAARYT